MSGGVIRGYLEPLRYPVANASDHLGRFSAGYEALELI
jgi:hypothetical protein